MSRGFAKGDPRAVSAGKKAGVVSGERRRQQREKRWERFDVDPVIGTEIRRIGYLAGWRKGYTAGLKKAAKGEQA